MSHMVYKWEILKQVSVDLFSTQYEVVKHGGVGSHSVSGAKSQAVKKAHSVSAEWGNWTMDRHPIEGDNRYICHSLKTDHILTLISIPI